MSVRAPGSEKWTIAAGMAVICGGVFLLSAQVNVARAASGWAYLSPATALDHHLPFRPAWVWVYLSYYPACFLPAVVSRRVRLFRQAAAGFAIQFLAAGVLFLLIPVRMIQPSVPGSGLSERLVRGLYAVDPGFNIFPSLHVANAILLAAICGRVNRKLGWFMWGWTIALSVSTLMIKQHYVVDLFAGALLAVAVIWLVMVRWDGQTPWATV